MRIAGVTCPHIYALTCMSSPTTAIVNLALSSVRRARRSKLAQAAASLAAFGLAFLAFLGSLFALALGRRPEITHEAITPTGESRRERESRRDEPPCSRISGPGH